MTDDPTDDPLSEDNRRALAQDILNDGSRDPMQCMLTATAYLRSHIVNSDGPLMDPMYGLACALVNLMPGWVALPEEADHTELADELLQALGDIALEIAEPPVCKVDLPPEILERARAMARLGLGEAEAARHTAVNQEWRG